MTLKSLFFKLDIEDLKKRIWAIALYILVFFLGLPVLCAMRLSTYTSYANNGSFTHEWIVKQMIRFMGPQNEAVVLITIIGAIICGLSSFFYLHSKKKVDLFHSVPVRREMLFGVNYINGILIFLVPYMFNALLSFIVIQVNGYSSALIVTEFFKALLINTLFYCLIYTVVNMAVMFTGNIIISCLGAAVFLLYGPTIMTLKEVYLDSFFETHFANQSINNSLLFLSPIGIYMDTINKFNNNGNLLGRLVQVLIVTILLVGFILFLYKKRPSEAAGKAMAFSISKPIIKFLLVVPLTLGGGILFRSIVSNGKNGWFVFGLIFSFFIIYGIIEIIYNFDIKSAFSFKKQMIVCGVIIIASASVFQFDLLRYDSYLPSKSSIKSMSVIISGLDETYQYLDRNANGVVFMNHQDYQLKYTNLTEFDAAYDLARIGAENIGKSLETDKYFTYYVKYKMKNGTVKYRYYTLEAKYQEQISEIYSEEGYKQGHYPIYRWKAEDINKVSCYNIFNMKEFVLDNYEKEELLNVYKAELSKQTITDLTNSYPIATITFSIHDYTLEGQVYPHFKNTIKFLNEHGFDADYRVSTKNIEKIELLYYPPYTSINMEENVTNEKIKYTSDESSRSVVITDEQQISKMFPFLVPREYAYNNNTILSTDQSIDVLVTIRKDDFGNDERFSYYFTRNNVPDFVKEAIGYQQ